MSLVARLFSGCLIVLTLAVFGAVAVGYGIYRFSDTASVRGGWSEPLAGATTIRADIDVDNGRVSIGDSLPAGPTVPDDTALQTEYRAGADSPIARSWLVDGDSGTATIGSEPEDLPVTALRWLHSPEQASWDVGLNPKVPVDLDVDVGVGSAQVDLTGLTTARFGVNVGIGDADVIVGGASAATEISRIRVGVGSVRLIVPQEVPVRIQVTAGFSDIAVPDGFFFDGTHYTNAAWQGLSPGESGLDLVIETGTGSVSVSLLLPATPGPVLAVPSEGSDTSLSRSSRSPVATPPARSPSAPVQTASPADLDAPVERPLAPISPPPVDSP